MCCPLIFNYKNLSFVFVQDDCANGNHRTDSSSNNSMLDNAKNNRNLNYSASSNGAILTAINQNSTSIQAQSEHSTLHSDNNCSASSNVANLYEYKSSNTDLNDESNSNKLNFISNPSSSGTASVTAAAAANAYMNSCLMFKNNLELLATNGGNNFVNNSPQNCTYVELQPASFFNCQLPSIDSLGTNKGTYV